MPYFQWKFVTKALLLLSLCIFLLFKGCASNSNSTASANWPVIEGSILSSEVASREDSRYAGAGLHNSVTCYYPKIQYEYKSRRGLMVNDDLSYNHTACIEGKRGLRLAKILVQQYQPGSKVQVYMNPQDPQSSCLKPGKTTTGFGFFFLSGIGIIGFIGYTGGRALDWYSKGGEFAGATAESYTETVYAPFSAYLQIAVAVLPFLWFVLPITMRLFIFPDNSLHLADFPKYMFYLLSHPPVLFLTVSLLITFMLFFWFNSKTISVIGSTLHLPPKRRGEKRAIIAENILSCEPRYYAYPLWGIFSRRGGSEQDLEIISVVGHRGPGILVTFYPLKTGFSLTKSLFYSGTDPIDRETIARVHIPCREPERICNLLTSK